MPLEWIRDAGFEWINIRENNWNIKSNIWTLRLACFTMCLLILSHCSVMSVSRHNTKKLGIMRLTKMRSFSHLHGYHHLSNISPQILKSCLFFCFWNILLRYQNAGHYTQIEFLDCTAKDQMNVHNCLYSSFMSLFYVI